MSSVWITFLVLDAGLSVFVGNLNAPRFRQREHAQHVLVKSGEWAIPALERGLKSRHLEIETRCRWILSQMEYILDKRAWEKSEHMLPTGWNELPWLHLQDIGYYGPAVERFMQAVHQSHPAGSWQKDRWEDWRIGTRMWVATQIRSGKTERHICSELDRMAWAEVGWIWREYCLWRITPVR